MNGSARVELHRICKFHGELQVLHDVDLCVEPGEFFSLLGPSGSGKTTTLRIVAGLESTTSGVVSIDGEDVTVLAPGHRDVAMVFQSYALYPHMTVFDNIAFPLRMVKTPKATVNEQVREAAERVGLGRLLDRRPGQLSGGQQQRVALARAIVRKPRVFLLDEPLSNLDAKLRVETRAQIRNLQKSLGTTTLYVTHDQEEAMALSDRLAVFLEGRVVQVGTPEEVFERPRTAGVAAFVGNPPMNLIPATLHGHELAVGEIRVQVAYDSGSKEQAVMLGLRPADLRLSPDGFPTEIALVEVLGEDTLLDVYFAGAFCRVRLPGKHRLPIGSSVHIAFSADAVHLFDAESGERLTASAPAHLA